MCVCVSINSWRHDSYSASLDNITDQTSFCPESKYSSKMKRQQFIHCSINICRNKISNNHSEVILFGALPCCFSNLLIQQSIAFNCLLCLQPTMFAATLSTVQNRCQCFFPAVQTTIVFLTCSTGNTNRWSCGFKEE